MPFFLGSQCWFSFDDKTPFPGVKAMLTCYVCTGPFFFFETLKKCNPDLFNVLCSDEIENWAENPTSPEQFLRVIWEVRFWNSLAQIKLFSILISDHFLIIFVNTCPLANLREVATG